MDALGRPKWGPKSEPLPSLVAAELKNMINKMKPKTVVVTYSPKAMKGPTATLLSKKENSNLATFVVYGGKAQIEGFRKVFEIVGKDEEPAVIAQKMLSYALEELSSSG